MLFRVTNFIVNLAVVNAAPNLMIETQTRSSWLSRASIIALLGLTLNACGGGGGSDGGTPSSPQKAPTLTLVTDPASDANGVVYGRNDDNFAIQVTATKQDNVGILISFPLIVNSTSSASTTECSAELFQTGVTGTVGDDNFVTDYPANSIGSNVTVTYNVDYPGQDTECGDFTFTATEDGKIGSAKYSGLRFVATNQKPRVATNRPPSYTHDRTGDDNFTIQVIATKQDALGNNNVSFPLNVTSTTGVNGELTACVANLDQRGSESSNGTHASWAYPANELRSLRTVNYNVTNPDEDTNCGTFTFTAIEDGLIGSAEYNGLSFVATNQKPVVSASIGDASPIYAGTDNDFTIEVTATKQDRLGGAEVNVSFPLEVVSVLGNIGGPVACTAVLVKEDGTPEDNPDRSYPENGFLSTVKATYNITYPGQDTACGEFTFNATEDGLTGSVVYRALSFSDANVDDDGDGLVDIRSAAELDNIRNHINNLTGVIVNPLGESCGPNANGECIGYELLNDIDLADYDSWTPIGINGTLEADYLNGIFEGNGNIIYNLNIDIQEFTSQSVNSSTEGDPLGDARRNADNVAGLFGAFAGDIRNLHLSDVSISAPAIAEVGGLVGVYRGDGGSIINSSVTGDAITGNTNVGGLVGRAQSNLVMDNVRADIDTITGYRVAGLIGAVYGVDQIGDQIRADAELEIVNSKVVSSQIDARDNAGGLLGYFNSAGNVSIGHSDVLVNSIRGRDDTGGLVGALFDGTTKDLSFAEIAIYASTVVADSIISEDEDAGGVLGFIGDNVVFLTANIDSTTVIARNINSNAIGIARNVGGLIGTMSGARAIIRSSSAIVDIIDSNSNSGGIIGFSSRLVSLRADAGAVNIFHSLAQNGIIKADSLYDELVTGDSDRPAISITSSYWNDNVTFMGGSRFSSPGGGTGENRTTLQDPAASIFNDWNGTGAGWCDPTTGEYTQDDEQPDGYATVWQLDVGEYPALNCLPITPAQQRAAIGLVQNDQSPLSVFEVEAAPMVTINPASGDLAYSRIDDDFTIQVTATKQDAIGGFNDGRYVSFPLIVNSTGDACSAVLNTAGSIDAISNATHATWIYPANRAGSIIPATYNVRYPGDGAVCGEFTFTATEDGLTASAAYSGLSFVAGGQRPVVMTNPRDPVIHDRTTGNNFTIAVTALKQDILGSTDVSFPRMVVSTAGACTAFLGIAGSIDESSNATHATWIYPENALNSPVTVTYNVTNPNTNSDTACGAFNFTATEDDETGGFIYSGLIFAIIAPPILTTDHDAPVALDIDTGDGFEIEVTATKQDNLADTLGNRVSFPRNVVSTSNAASGISQCTADLDTTDSASANPTTYPSNSKGETVTVTYSVTNPNSDIFCGTFNFTATTASGTGSVVYSGLSFYDADRDVDDDNDGLVDIRSGAELNSIRTDLTTASLHGVNTGCPMNADNQLECMGYELLNNIDLSYYSAWERIGINATDDADYVNGTFEGNGNVIYNLSIDIQEFTTTEDSDDNVAGLFGAFEGDIRNLHLSNVSISAPVIANVGALVGVYRGDGGSIINSSVSGDNITGKNYVGGLVGRSEAHVIMDNVSVDFDTITGKDHVGGLIGVIAENTQSNVFGIIDTSYFDLTIDHSNVLVNSIIGGRNVGGLVGYLNGRNFTGMHSNVFVSNINAGQHAGGFVGEYRTSSTPNSILTSVVVADNIIGRHDVGGMIGNMGGSSGSYDITSSMAIVANITSTGGGNNEAGGIIGAYGIGRPLNIRSSAAIANNITTITFEAGGFIGWRHNDANTNVFQSLALTRHIEIPVNPDKKVGGIFGREPLSGSVVNSSYWQYGVVLVGTLNPNQGGATAQPMANLTDPTNDIFEYWDGAGAGWCNPTTGEYALGAPTNLAAPAGYDANNTVWQFKDEQYPALRCLPITPTQQRAAIGLVQSGKSPLPAVRP